MENLTGRKAIYKSPYSGIEVEIEIKNQSCHRENNHQFPHTIVSTNGACYPFKELKLI